MKINEHETMVYLTDECKFMHFNWTTWLNYGFNLGNLCKEKSRKSINSKKYNEIVSESLYYLNLMYKNNHLQIM